jgi:cell division protein FtsZ
MEVVKPEEEQQITLTFDLPLTPEKEEEKDIIAETITYNLDENQIKDIPVNDYVELVTVTETKEDSGDVRYALDDYTDEEPAKSKQAQASEVVEEVEEELVFERKVVTEEGAIESEIAENEEPTEMPISEILRERTAERRRKMKDFNYKFNTSKIDDIEKVPAYKRQGVNLEDAKHSSDTDLSRTSVGLDDNDDIQLRTNNSFLHDNVD